MKYFCAALMSLICIAQSANAKTIFRCEVAADLLTSTITISDKGEAELLIKDLRTNVLHRCPLRIGRASDLKHGISPKYEFQLLREEACAPDLTPDLHAGVYRNIELIIHLNVVPRKAEIFLFELRSKNNCAVKQFDPFALANNLARWDGQKRAVTSVSAPRRAKRLKISVK